MKKSSQEVAQRRFKNKLRSKRQINILQFPELQDTKNQSVVTLFFAEDVEKVKFDFIIKGDRTRN